MGAWHARSLRTPRRGPILSRRLPDRPGSCERGDLTDLVRLFSRLEIVALRSELELPAQPAPADSGAADVARAYVERLRLLQKGRSESKSAGAEQMAVQLQERVNAYLDELGTAVHPQFVLLDETAQNTLTWAAPPDERASWWAAQIYQAAGRADFFVNRAAGTWWSSLRLVVQDWTMRYVAVIQKVGRGETGVLALTAFAEAAPPRVQEGGDSQPSYLSLLETTEAESVTFVHTEDISVRQEEVRELLDRTLAAAVAHFAERLDQ